MSCLPVLGSLSLGVSLSFLSLSSQPKGALTSEEEIDKGHFKVVLDPRGSLKDAGGNGS